VQSRDGMRLGLGLRRNIWISKRTIVRLRIRYLILLLVFRYLLCRPLLLLILILLLSEWAMQILFCTLSLLAPYLLLLIRLA
jgi:hypothetical protein